MFGTRPNIEPGGHQTQPAAEVIRMPGAAHNAAAARPRLPNNQPPILKYWWVFTNLTVPPCSLFDSVSVNPKSEQISGSKFFFARPRQITTIAALKINLC